MPSSGMLRRVVFVTVDVSEELSASIIMVKRIGELKTTLAVTSNRSTLGRSTILYDNIYIYIYIYIYIVTCYGWVV
jgi:hypothetical protein